MRTKRLLCVCAALALLLSVPAHAAEAPDVPETPEPWEEPTVDPVPEDTTDDPEEVPEIPEVPEVPPETEEPPEVPEDPEDPPEDPEAPPEEDEPPAEDEELPEESESPEEVGEAEEAEEPEDEPAPQEDEAPVIHVEVPDTGRVVVNPYHLEVNMDGVSSTDQIVSAPMPIVSYSSVPVAVTASVTGHTSPGSGAVFVSSQPRSSAKELFLFAEFQPAFDAYGSAFWSGQYTGASNQLVVTAGGSPAAQVLELAAGDVVPSYGAFRLFGSASGSPERMWSAEDAIHVTLTFTFVPLV